MSGVAGTAPLLARLEAWTGDVCWCRVARSAQAELDNSARALRAALASRGALDAGAVLCDGPGWRASTVAPRLRGVRRARSSTVALGVSGTCSDGVWPVLARRVVQSMTARRVRGGERRVWWTIARETLGGLFRWRWACFGAPGRAVDGVSPSALRRTFPNGGNGER